jgi:3-oxoacyl-[acyl-carrier protein] reductase
VRCDASLRRSGARSDDRASASYGSTLGVAVKRSIHHPIIPQTQAVAATSLADCPLKPPRAIAGYPRPDYSFPHSVLRAETPGSRACDHAEHGGWPGHHTGHWFPWEYHGVSTSDIGRIATVNAKIQQSARGVSNSQARGYDLVDIRDKTVLITGAGGGIGRALAIHFAAKGANLALLDTNSADLDGTAAICAHERVTVRGYVANVSEEDVIETTFDQIVADFGRLDGLINNAGVVRDAMLVKVKDGQVAGKMTLTQWQAVIDVNLTGVFLCAREAAQRMIGGNSGGVIVNISSISRAGNVGQTNYSAAKAGVVAMTVVWAKELARHGIRVGAVAPGFIRTPMVEEMRPEVLTKVIAPVPLRRLGEAAEISQAVSFIFANDFFTGRCLEVDGGLRL